MDTPWHIELLGRLRATQGDLVVTRFRSQRTAALLAYLAYHLHRPHPRELLIELLWPEAEPSSGRNNLSRELTSLRRQLEPPGIPAGAVIIADRATVQLNPEACATDVMRFEAALRTAANGTDTAERVSSLRAAAALYQGDLLPSHFEDWVLPERQRLKEAFLTALSRLSAHFQEVGDPHAAIEWARLAVAADALGEEAHHDLIRALVSAGETNAALRQYHELERLLAEEFGGTPTPETRALVNSSTRPPHLISSPAGPAARPEKKDRLRSPAPTSASNGDGLGDGHTNSVTADLALPTAQVSRLPQSFTRFFGRQGEIETLRTLLLTSAARLVTLIGPGGTGKTRLALETARQVQPDLEGRVWFVLLLDLTDPHLIAGKLLESLRISRSPQIEPLEQITAFLSDTGAANTDQVPRPVILVLDNFEHLVEGGRDLVRTLLERVEGLTVLVTSRRCLGLQGEQEFPVPPLPIPVHGCQRTAQPLTLTYLSDPSDPSDPSDLPSLAQCSSVRLFVDRAQAVRPDFQVTRTNATALAHLCAALEGLPLALELAAARIGVLTPQQMLERLQGRFELLAGGRRGADPRHVSLRATLDWSYQLLSPEMQRFFAQLSVFRGGWTLDAAQAVCEEPRVLECLDHLRQASLVQTAETCGETRFRLLETLREYAAEQLGPGERAVAAHRHAFCYLALAERAEPDLATADQAAWLDRLGLEQDNLRAASASLEASRRIQEALRLEGALWHYHVARGDIDKGLERLRSLLALPGAEDRTSARAKALNGAGVLAEFAREHASSRCLHEEGLAIGRELDDPWNIAFGLTGLGHTLDSIGCEAGDESYFERAHSLLEEALALWHKIGDRWGAAYALNGLGWVACNQHDYAAARDHWYECLTVRREHGNQWGIALTLFHLGVLAQRQENWAEARSLWQECLAVAQQSEDRYLSGQTLLSLGSLAHRQGDLSTARAHLEQCLPLVRAAGVAHLTGEALGKLATVAIDQGDLDAASAYLEQAMGIWRQIGDRAGIAGALHTRGRIAIQHGDLDVANECFAESLALWKEIGEGQPIAECLEGLASVTAAQGRS